MGLEALADWIEREEDQAAIASFGTVIGMVLQSQKDEQVRNRFSRVVVENWLSIRNMNRATYAWKIWDSCLNYCSALSQETLQRIRF